MVNLGIFSITEFNYKMLKYTLHDKVYFTCQILIPYPHRSESLTAAMLYVDLIVYVFAFHMLSQNTIEHKIRKGVA